MSFDFVEFFYLLVRLIAAFLLSFPVAWEREQSTRRMGLRTFPLVAMASCGYVLVASAVVGSGSEQQARIIQGLMSGIGFIGGGAILKQGGGVDGTATAASIWTTGVIGAAVAYQDYEIAVVVSLINFLTLRLLTPVERKTGKPDRPKNESPNTES
jgi:putative Mg2+ transporter-C (MgtC) family protein